MFILISQINKLPLCKIILHKPECDNCKGSTAQTEHIM